MEPMEAMEPILAEHPFFQGLEPGHLKLIAECATRVQFKANQYLCKEEQEAHQFYVILHGRVAVEIFSARRGPITIQTVGEGEVLGWLWFLQPYHWHVDARATEVTRAIALDVQCLLSKCEKNHELGYQLMKRYAHSLAVQFRVAKFQLADIYGT
ncbi:MAG: cyclic nucleotide-binding domain-containing protein [Thermodesulfobacteriota bacterium]